MEKRRNCSWGAISPLFHNIFNIYFYIVICEIWLFELFFFLNTTNLICRSTDISKCFRRSLRFRDNEKRLYMFLFSSAPQEGDNHQQNNKNLAELQARKNAIDIVSAICRVATDLLHRAQSMKGYIIRDSLGKSQLFSSLLPLAMAYIGPVASQDPRVCI